MQYVFELVCCHSSLSRKVKKRLKVDLNLAKHREAWQILEILIAVFILYPFFIMFSFWPYQLLPMLYI